MAAPQPINVEDLNIYYGDFLAVEGVGMTIRARSVTAFIGPSGCGKSTFLRSMNRMNDTIANARVEGRIELDEPGPFEPANLLIGRDRAAIPGLELPRERV